MQLKLTAYKGVDPEDGTATYMVTLTNPDEPGAVDCTAWGDTEGSTDGLETAQDPEAVKVMLGIGVYRLGRAQPIAHQFLAMPTTEQLWQVDVEGSRRQ